jgi:hypothetical protein
MRFELRALASAHGIGGAGFVALHKKDCIRLRDPLCSKDRGVDGGAATCVEWSLRRRVRKGSLLTQMNADKKG